MDAQAHLSDAHIDQETLLAEAERNFRLGTMLNDAQNYPASVECLRRAYAIVPSPQIANNLAIALTNNGEALEARMLLERVLENDADFTLGWVTHGAALKSLGQTKKARESFARAVALDPAFTAARHNLAMSLHGAGDYVNALAEFETLVAQEPANIGAHVGLCRTLQSLNRHAEVIDRIGRLRRTGCECGGLDEVLALSLERTGQYDAALEAADRFLADHPDRAATHMIRANCLSELDRHDESLAALSQALRYVGADVTLLHVIASFMESLKMFHEAIDIYQTILRNNGADGHATARLFDLRLALCDWSDYDALCGDLVDHVKQDMATGQRLSVDVFNLQALPLDYVFIGAAARHHASAIARETAAIAAPFVHTETKTGPGKRRIGYLLPYTWIHSLPLVLREVVRLHDRDRFEVRGYCTHACAGTEFSRSYRAAFDRFTDLPSHAPYEAARTIHGDDLDLLIDVAGLTGMNCMDILAFRPAPIQAHFLGYSITTGADFVDYLITDKTYIPPKWQQHNTEHLVYLPGTFMATAREDAAPGSVSRADFGLPDNAVVFANFNHPCKFEPAIFDAWMTILKSVPGGVLWFGSWLNETADNLRREAEARGVSGQQLIFSDIVDRDIHLARLSLADLALDNLYHGGGITTVDALWAGLPVLTIAGDLPGARLGATLLTAANMPELVMPNLGAYVRTAVDLAADTGKRQALKVKLASQRDNCPLFDTELYCRNLEAGFDAMIDRRALGLPNQLIDLSQT